MYIVKELLYNFTLSFAVHMELELWKLLLPGDPFPNPILFKYAYHQRGWHQTQEVRSKLTKSICTKFSFLSLHRSKPALTLTGTPTHGTDSKGWCKGGGLGTSRGTFFKDTDIHRESCEDAGSVQPFAC